MASKRSGAALAVDATKKSRSDPVSTGYQHGFGNDFSTEALPGALPERGNTPQVVRAISHEN